MINDTDTIVTMAEANQNFSKVARLVDQNGSAIIMKNNKPRYIIYDLYQKGEKEIISDEKLLEIARNILERDREAFLELAK